MSSKRHQTLREIFGKHKILKLFDKRPFKIVEMVIPSDTYTKMSYMYMLCHSNGVGVTFITDFIFNFGIDIFLELMEKFNLKNIFDLMKIKVLVKNTIKTLFEKSQQRYPMIDISDYRRIEIEFDRRKYTIQQRLEFLDMVNHFDKSFLHKEKLILDWEDIQILFEAHSNIQGDLHEHF